MGEQNVEMTVALGNCFTCHQPLHIINGKIQEREGVDIVFTMRDGVPVATPHRNDCPDNPKRSSEPDVFSPRPSESRWRAIGPDGRLLEADPPVDHGDLS